jgi:hypothetical protein
MENFEFSFDTATHGFPQLVDDGLDLADWPVAHSL